MTDCYRPGHERGLWFEIKCIEETIQLKESLGHDATFEKELLASYRRHAKAEGYKSKALDNEYHFNEAGLKDKDMVNTTNTNQILTLGIMKHAGRPRKDINLSRTTIWRRKKEVEKVVLV